MRNWDEHEMSCGIDCSRGRYPEEGLPARNLAAGDGWEQAVPLMPQNFGRWERLGAMARHSSLVLLLIAAVMLVAPIASPAQVSVGVSVTFAPPPIPVYAQPLCPGPGFIWIPGYWAWDPYYGYYWVPGMWVLAPFVGALWTPGYWAWSNGVYVWYEGYWGPVVGFYGGINYGYGYTGYGYYGGYWSGGRYYYNRTVNNINVNNINTVYSRSVRNARPAGVSFNGGPGGSAVRPTSEQLAAARERRTSITESQRQQMEVSRTDPRQRANANHGRPAVAATPRAGEFTGRGVTGATRAGGPYKAPPSTRAVPGERARTPKPGAEMRPPAAVPGEHVRTPKPGAEMRPPAAAPERVEPGRRMNEPRPAPPRPERAEPSPQKERGRDEREEPR